MIILEKTIKILKVNRRGTTTWTRVNEGDLVTIKFGVEGHGGNSPKVDIYINGNYKGTPFARKFNQEYFKEEIRFGKIEKLPIVASYEEVTAND